MKSWESLQEHSIGSVNLSQFILIFAVTQMAKAIKRVQIDE
jgi:hypothetical protein